MEGLVVKVLRKYLSLFINNFSKDNFNLSIMKGRGEYRNLGEMARVEILSAES